MRCDVANSLLRSEFHVEKSSDGQRLGGAVPVHRPGVEQDGCKHKCKWPVPEALGEQRPGPERLRLGGRISELSIFTLSVRNFRIQLWSREGYAILHPCRRAI